MYKFDTIEYIFIFTQSTCAMSSLNTLDDIFATVFK